MHITRIIITITIFVIKNEAARILAVCPTPSLSHQIIFYPLLQELATRHEVVFITTNPAYPEGNSPKNLTEIDLKDLSYGLWRKEFTMSKFGRDVFIYKGVKAIVEMIPKVFEEQMKAEDVQNLIKNEKPFDLLLLQAYFRPAMVWSHIYKVPVIKVSSVGMAFDNAEDFGAPIHPLLYPDCFHQRVYDLTFWEKITELYKRYYVQKLFNENEASENEMVKRILGPGGPALSELKKNVHAMFLNVNSFWDRHRPLPKNVVYFGRIHQKPKKELPEDIKSFLDASPQGVIYMSFGTNIPPSLLPPATIQMFLRVFSQIPYRVLWKWDGGELEGKPDNLMVGKWLPQADVFRHPNMKLVVTQGGLQTTEEAVSSGLPLVGVPMLADQWLNVEHYVHYGFGVKVDFETICEEEFKTAILKVIEDGSYRNNVLRFRSLVHDAPLTPLQRAVSWTEYVLRHGGGHLTPSAAILTWWEYLEVELLMTVLGSLMVFIYIVYLVLKLVLGAVLRKL